MATTANGAVAGIADGEGQAERLRRQPAASPPYHWADAPAGAPCAEAAPRVASHEPSRIRTNAVMPPIPRCTASGCADSLGAVPHDLAIAANDILSSTLSVLDRKEWHPAARHRGRQPGYR